MLNTMDDITGMHLKSWGVQPGPGFGELLAKAKWMQQKGRPVEQIKALILESVAVIEEQRLARMIPMRAVPMPFRAHLERGPSEDERRNYEAVVETMANIGRTPVLKGMAVMPDACPVGGAATIPVGGAVSSTEIHPGFHSADVCCSVAMTVFTDADPKTVLDMVHAATHFGRGGYKQPRYKITANLREWMASNRFTQDLIEMANKQLGTQGDGNHFAYVGRLASTGETCLVTHHGSRGVGATIYKRGMEVAEKTRRELCPELDKECAWITAESRDGEAYRDALQIAREWTLENHLALHTAVNLPIRNFVWNEHNFVFRRSDGLFYHGKGATPATPDYGITLVPLNMAEPVLVTQGQNSKSALGFSPHGAGRLFSRAEHIRRGGGDLEAETAGLDVRFYCGDPDSSELPSAYKDAATVRRQTEEFGLARVVDEVQPYGCIMAGDVDKNAPWRLRREAKIAAREQVQ